MSLLGTAACGRADAPRLLLATTTSTEDSGLLQAILPLFEEQYQVRVQVVAVGSGQALKLGEDGNADVLLVHSPALEEAFMAGGHGVRREEVMYNDFVIVGPAADPASIRGGADAAAALRVIAAAQVTFISRGDESGTHVKEKWLWHGAGVEPAGEWYLSIGQGMGETLGAAAERQAYSLSDRATFLKRKQLGLALEILVEGDASLINQYSVIAVNPAKGAHIQAELADEFIDWLMSEGVQRQIAQFGLGEFGEALFFVKK